MPTVMKYESLNLLENSGPLRACKGTALGLPLHDSRFVLLTTCCV